ncbi:MAG: YbaB/EbfC family nucleoid-associated protein [Armatimonadota bacterium]|nr:YbaB/EbfC family nucleoid-associated protein [Armatimonadota bacterium]MCX7777997.1 YbaB/EbfC family nucleoid-associated protein [Armatimonadota bacterium]MDW8026028.1 YbaB/EbfC family nucleoid-associated protein [Armatimonadota bacterium]
MRNLLQQLLMRKAMHLQERIASLQRELDEMRVEGISGGGVVKAIASGSGELLEIKISPELLKPDEIELLEDLVLVAVRDALAKAQEASADKWRSLLTELGIPPELLTGRFLA